MVESDRVLHTWGTIVPCFAGRMNVGKRVPSQPQISDVALGSAYFPAIISAADNVKPLSQW